MDFPPAPRKTLRGWTPDRQRRFIAALAATGSVASAAGACEMTREGAYALRAAPGAEGFAAAWDAAIRDGIRALKSVAFDRAVHGEPVPIYHQGEAIGERRHYNNQLLLRLLTHYDPQPRAAEAAPAGDPGVRPSSPSVEARLRSKMKPIARMDDADFMRNAEWQRVTQLDNHLNALAQVAVIRRWIAQGGLDAVEAHLGHLERTAAANPAITATMRAEIAETGEASRPWTTAGGLLQLFAMAEAVEAAIDAGVVARSRGRWE